ncbi:major capsid protein, partial [Actinosynnema sp.]|uniref:major capsid protein n=1 Tax=Actinosynnema sp. TaxID=1872144 RepID=UPI003F84DF47
MQYMDLVDDLRPVILAAREFSDDRNTLSQFLPNTAVQAITFRLGRRQKVDQTVPVRAFGAPATPITRPGVAELRGDLPAITPRVDLTEVDLNQEFVLAQQLAGQQVDYQPWVVAAAGIAAATIDNTLELMRGQALSTGKVSLAAEDGGGHEVDFEVPADNKITVATPWSTDPEAAFADLEAAHEAFHETSGAPAGRALTTIKVYRLLMKALQTMYPQQPVGATNLNAYLTERGLPGITTYDRTLQTSPGARTRIYPEGHLTFLPGDVPVGRTELGVTQESVQQVQNRVLAPSEA